MPRLDYKTCKRCRGSVSEVGTLSHTRLCVKCSEARLIENLAAMETKRGPFAQWWAHQIAASVGLAPLDGAPPRP